MHLLPLLHTKDEDRSLVGFLLGQIHYNTHEIQIDPMSAVGSPFCFSSTRMAWDLGWVFQAD